MAGKLCCHAGGIREYVLEHHGRGVSVSANPRVLQDDGETMVYFKCLRCTRILPAGSTTPWCEEHPNGNPIVKGKRAAFSARARKY
jgi:hypothetical protein